jgi:arylsulfatase A-like enzyme
MSRGFAEYLCRKPRLSTLALRNGSKLAWLWSPRTVVYADKPYFTAPELTRAAAGWLDRHRDAPFLLVLNYMDTHLPNATPGSQGLDFEDEAFHMGVESTWSGRPTPAERRSYLNEYDREVIHLDHWLGVLLDHVERSGLAARTLVIVTSDHGEFLGEHDYYGHTRDIYAETVNVPMIVWEPGRRPGRVSRPVQSPDLFPTVLRYLGLPVPPAAQGQGLLEADHPIVSEEYYQPFGTDPRFARIIRAIRADGHRYFDSSTGEKRLFDFAGDPHETRNLIARQPAVAALARERLDEWLLKIPEPAVRAPAPQLDAGDLDDLRALGYIR